MAMRKAISPIGPLIPNSHGQGATANTAEATVGPMAADVATANALMPMARPSIFWGYVKRTSAALVLMMPAAPSPWITRAMLNETSEWEKAQPSEARVNTTIPNWETRR